MKVTTYEDRESWLEARRGKITGTRVGKLLSKRDGKPLSGYYELIAEIVAIPHDGENVMDRGLRLEDEAIERFTKETGKKVSKDLVIWSREDNPDIALSPDGAIGKTEALECKCLSSAAHIETYLTQHIPDEYWPQVLQYFVVNDTLQTLHFVFYDPRMPKDFFWIDVTREQVEAEVQLWTEREHKVLEEVKKIVEQLTF